MCTQQLIMDLNVDTAAETLILANLYRAHHLKSSTLLFINANFEVTNSNGWKKLETHPQLLTEAFKHLMGVYNQALTSVRMPMFLFGSHSSYCPKEFIVFYNYYGSVFCHSCRKYLNSSEIFEIK